MKVTQYVAGPYVCLYILPYVIFVSVYGYILIYPAVR